MIFSKSTPFEAKHRLTDLQVGFVSLCGRGMHPDSNVTLYKSDPTSADVHVNRPIGSDDEDEEDEIEKSTPEKRRALVAAAAERRNKLRRVAEGGKATDTDEDDEKRKAGEKDSEPRSAEAARRRLAELEKSQTWPSLAPILAAVQPTHHGRADMTAFNLPDDTPSEVVDYVTALEDRVIKAEAEAEAAEEEEDEDEKVDKASIAGILRKAEAAEKRAEHAEAIAKAEHDRRVSTEVLAKAEKLQALGFTVEETAEVLKGLRNADPELATKVEGLLDSAATAVEKSSIFDEFGTPGASVSGGKLEAAVKEIRKGEPTLDEWAAVAKAYEADPALYADYLAEKKG